jgi:hypothetical protein
VERLSSLTTKLKDEATSRASDVQAAKARQESEAPASPKLHKQSAQDRTRVRAQKARLKASIPPKSASPVTDQPERPTSPSPLLEMNPEERIEHAQRARDILQEKLRHLSRKRSRG